MKIQFEQEIDSTLLNLILELQSLRIGISMARRNGSTEEFDLLVATYNEKLERAKMPKLKGRPE